MNTSDIKPGSGFLAEEIKRRADWYRNYAETLRRVGIETRTPQHRIETLVARELEKARELEESLK